MAGRSCGRRMDPRPRTMARSSAVGGSQARRLRCWSVLNLGGGGDKDLQSDEGGNGKEQPIPSEGNGDSAEFAFISPPSHRTLAPGAQIEPIVLPVAVGEAGNLRYDVIHPAQGLKFDRTTRTLSGTPEVPGEHLIFYAASDDGGSVAVTAFTVTVGNDSPSRPTVADEKPTFGDGAVAPQIWIVGNTISPLALPAAAGGDAPIRYDLDPPIPGIFFNRSSRTIFGDPTRLGNFTMRLSATDADGDSASIFFPVQVAVAADTSPTLQLASLSRDYVVGVEQSDAFPAGGGGNAPLAYALSPAPPGMKFDPATRVLSGSPTRTGIHRARYTVTDADGDRFSTTFNISVVASPSADMRPSFGGAALGDFLGLRIGRSASFAVPVARGGNGPLTYSFSGAPGFAAAPTGGRICGTPTRAGSFDVTLTATDSDGDAAVTSGRMFVAPRSREAWQPAINAGGRQNRGRRGGGTARVDADERDSIPSFGRSATRLRATVGVPMCAVLPAATGGSTPLGYALSEIPGLEFDGSTRLLSGTPTSAGTYNALYLAFDADRTIATNRFVLRVAAAPPRAAAVQQQGANAPESGSMTLPAAAATFDGVLGEAFTATLPAAIGGIAPITYALASAPRGLRFDGATRVLSGIPQTAGNQRIRYTASDGDGNRAAGTVIIRIGTRVEGTVDWTPSFPFRAYAARGTVDEPLSLSLPRASGGNGDLTYVLGQPVPGLRLDEDRAVLSGTPTSAGNFSIKCVVTDADGDSDTLLFQLHITP